MCPSKRLTAWQGSSIGPWLLPVLPSWGDRQSLPEALPLWAPWELLRDTPACKGRKPRGGSVKCHHRGLQTSTSPLLVGCPLPLCLLQPAPLPKDHIAGASLPPFTTLFLPSPVPTRMLIWQCPLQAGPARTRQQWGKGTHWTWAVTLLVSLGSCPTVGLLLENEAEVLLALTSPDVVCGMKCEADSPSAEAIDAQDVALSRRGHLGKGAPRRPETRTGRILVALDTAPEHMWPWPQPHSILLLLQHLWGPIGGPARTWTFGSGAPPPPPSCLLPLPPLQCLVHQHRCVARLCIALFLSATRSLLDLLKVTRR